MIKGLIASIWFLEIAVEGVIGGDGCPINSSPYDSTCVCENGYYNGPTGMGEEFPPKKKRMFKDPPLNCNLCTTPCQRCSTKENATCVECLVTHAHQDFNMDCVCPAGSSVSGGMCVCVSPSHMDCSGPSCSCSFNCPPNSSPYDSTCVCNDGYYNSDPLGLNCNPCTTSCQRCSTKEVLKCIDCTVTYAYEDSNGDCVCPPNSSPYDSTCVCEDGFYNSASPGSLTCSSCTSNCQRCSTKEDPDCVQCLVTHSYEDSNGDCVCPANSSISGGVCVCQSPKVMNCLGTGCKCAEECPLRYTPVNNICTHKPTAVLEVPSLVLIECQDLVMTSRSEKPQGIELYYQWSVTSDPYNPSLNQFSTSTSKSIKINKELLQMGTVYVTLTVRNNLGETDSVSKAVEIKSAFGIVFNIDNAVPFEIQRQGSYYISAGFTSSCTQ